MFLDYAGLKDEYILSEARQFKRDLKIEVENQKQPIIVQAPVKLEVFMCYNDYDSFTIVNDVYVVFQTKRDLRKSLLKAYEVYTLKHIAYINNFMLVDPYFGIIGYDLVGNLYQIGNYYLLKNKIDSYTLLMGDLYYAKGKDYKDFQKLSRWTGEN